MRRTLILLPLLLLAGCQPAPVPLSGTGMDMFGATAMRIHPLSRILSVPATGPATQPAVVIEALLEFSDQFGDPTKAPGTADLELYDLGPLNIRGRKLDSWHVSFDTPETNRDAWDRVTRTYLFRLSTPLDLARHPRLLLVATTRLPNGTLTDSLALSAK